MNAKSHENGNHTLALNETVYKEIETVVRIIKRETNFVHGAHKLGHRKKESAG